MLKRLLASCFALLAMTAGIVTLSAPASAQSLVYQAVDSDNDPYDGIYLRNGTSMDYVDRVFDNYMYYGDSFELICGAWGDAVGPNNNRRWHFVEVLDGPAAYQTGWIADRYTNTPNVANQPTPGEPECEEGGAVYFEPRWQEGDPQPGSGEAMIIDKDSWSAGNCTTDNVDDYVPTMLNGKRVTSMGTWSISRLAPTYMVGENWELMRQFNFVVMYDPGSYANYTDPESCDMSYNQSAAMLQWLNDDPNNVLMVLAGEDTYDPNWLGNGNYEGIRQFLLDDIEGQPAASQVYVCGYHTMAHADVADNFGYVLANGHTTTCPGNPDDTWQP